MTRVRSRSVAFLALLIGALVLHNVVMLSPHSHAADTAHTDAGFLDHWCSHDTPEALPMAEIHSSAPCLACVIPTPAFASPGDAAGVVRLEPVHAASTTHDRPAAEPARRWHSPMRGPPARA
jgi:hypothetical protein